MYLSHTINNGVRTLLAALGLFLCSPGLKAAVSDWRILAEQSFATATASLKGGTNMVQANWEYARACFDLAEFSTNHTERADLAKKGIDAARLAIKANPSNAPARYYLGMNLGQLARTRYLSALRMVDEMEREFLKARELNAAFDYAGSDRNLGLLYRDAPSIGSIGSRRKAQHHLEAAVQLAPIYPENRLILIESYLKWGDRNGSVREFKLLDANWDQARKELAGKRWESSWADWEGRRARLAERLKQSLPGLKSPRDH